LVGEEIIEGGEGLGYDGWVVVEGWG